MNVEDLVPILVPLGFFALVFGIVYMQKKESLARIEKGLNPAKQVARGPEPLRYLKWGLLLVGAGFGLFIAYVLDHYVMGFHDNEPIYLALVAIGGGVGLIISYRMEMKELGGKRSTESTLPSEL